MTKKKIKTIEKPKAVRKTVVDFCKKNNMSVRQFVNNAHRTRLATNKDLEKMELHLSLWKRYNWL